ncbi:MAG: hypothetical protein SNJ57_07740 [Cyanobacteriota bacterium]
MFLESQPLPISAAMPDAAVPPQSKSLPERSPVNPLESDAAPDPLEHQQHIQTRELINRPRAIHYQQRRLF